MVTLVKYFYLPESEEYGATEERVQHRKPAQRASQTLMFTSDRGDGAHKNCYNYDRSRSKPRKWPRKKSTLKLLTELHNPHDRIV